MDIFLLLGWQSCSALALLPAVGSQDLASVHKNRTIELVGVWLVDIKVISMLSILSLVNGNVRICLSLYVRAGATRPCKKIFAVIY